jgi:hypothetical protein
MYIYDFLLQNCSSVVSGGMRDSRMAAWDPIFYLHHAYIDKLYDQWLRLHPDAQVPEDFLVGLGGWSREVSRQSCVFYAELDNRSFFLKNETFGNITVQLSQVPEKLIGQMGGTVLATQQNINEVQGLCG